LIKMSITPPRVEGLFDGFNGIPYIHYYNHPWAYETFTFDDIWNCFYLTFSIMYAISYLRGLGTMYQFLGGYYSALSWFEIFPFLWYRSNEPWIVVSANIRYMFRDFMATVLTSMIMWWTYPMFVVYSFVRGSSFDYDFDELTEDGYRFSMKQGLVYHYFGDSRYQTFF